MSKLEAKISTNILNLVGKAFKIDWCDTCETIFVICPLCGMNTCSGGYGKINNHTCPMCHLAYELDAKLQVYILSNN